jgi:hypothetical protein
MLNVMPEQRLSAQEALKALTDGPIPIANPAPAKESKPKTVQAPKRTPLGAIVNGVRQGNVSQAAVKQNSAIPRKGGVANKNPVAWSDDKENQVQKIAVAIGSRQTGLVIRK